MTEPAGRAGGDRAGRPLLLLRHAWAGRREDWDGDDRLRPLDARGRAQAAALVVASAAAGLTVGAVVSSPLVRCVTTVEPLAAAPGLRVRTDERLAEVDVPAPSDDGWPHAAWLGARAAAAVDAAVDACDGVTGTLVLCSHGEVLPALLASLAGRADRPLPADLDLTAKALPKGGGWFLPDGLPMRGTDAAVRVVTFAPPPV